MADKAGERRFAERRKMTAETGESVIARRGEIANETGERRFSSPAHTFH